MTPDLHDLLTAPVRALTPQRLREYRDTLSVNFLPNTLTGTMTAGRPPTEHHLTWQLNIYRPAYRLSTALDIGDGKPVQIQVPAHDIRYIRDGVVVSAGSGMVCPEITTPIEALWRQEPYTRLRATMAHLVDLARLAGALDNHPSARYVDTDKHVQDYPQIWRALLCLAATDPALTPAQASVAAALSQQWSGTVEEFIATLEAVTTALTVT